MYAQWCFGGDLLAWNLSSPFLLLLTGKMPGYIQQQLLISSGFVARPFAGNGRVNFGVLPCFFSPCTTQDWLFELSDQTLHGKTKEYCMLSTIYCYRPLHVNVFICRASAEALKTFIVDLCKHSI